MAKHDPVADCLRAKKAAGKPIDAQAKAICISEAKRKKSKMTEHEYFRPIPIVYQIVDLNPENG